MPSTSVQIWISSRADAGADERAGIVRAAAAKRRGMTRERRADESAKHRHAARVETRQH